jgi:hypothetical protein
MHAAVVGEVSLHIQPRMGSFPNHCTVLHSVFCYSAVLGVLQLTCRFVWRWGKRYDPALDAEVKSREMQDFARHKAKQAEHALGGMHTDAKHAT